MYDYAIVKQVKRKTKAMSGVLRKVMVIFAVIFVLLGVMISQGFMLPGFLMVVLYFGYDVYSQKEYEYRLDGRRLTIDVIMGKRYRKNAHVLELSEMEVTAPSRHDAVAKYRKDAGGQKLPKYDYTSYEENTPYYTMIIMQNRTKIKVLLDLDDEMLQPMKQMYPDRVFLAL